MTPQERKLVDELFERLRSLESAPRDPDAIVLALAADHVVTDTPAFVAACREGLAAAKTGSIVTFGVEPTRPATEYGYIRPGEVVSGRVRAVASFVEKPDPKTAEVISKMLRKLGR